MSTVTQHTVISNAVRNLLFLKLSQSRFLALLEMTRTMRVNSRPLRHAQDGCEVRLRGLGVSPYAIIPGMSIYAIADLHLSLCGAKPMDIFGEAWRDHAERIAANWDAIVSPRDTVIVVGDHSWALRFEQAKPDLDYIAARPGAKILVRGNHDYWWRREATTRIQKQLPAGMTLLHGHAIVIENVGITGTRGWRLELPEDPDAGDARVMARELAYLERGLGEIPPTVCRKIVALHYPPFNADLEPNAFADVLQAHGVDILVYGHIHTGFYLEGDIEGVEYRLVSADHVDMRPVRVVP